MFFCDSGFPGGFLGYDHVTGAWGLGCQIVPKDSLRMGSIFCTAEITVSILQLKKLRLRNWGADLGSEWRSMWCFLTVPAAKSSIVTFALRCAGKAPGPWLLGGEMQSVEVVGSGEEAEQASWEWWHLCCPRSIILFSVCPASNHWQSTIACSEGDLRRL